MSAAQAMRPVPLVDHLWKHKERIDIAYICSSAEIARLNISRHSAFQTGPHFGAFTVRSDRRPTSVGASIQLDNRSGVGQIEDDIRARLRYLCHNADGQWRVLEYNRPVRIAEHGQHRVDLGSALGGRHGVLESRTVEFHNDGDWRPHNAHVLITYEGVPIHEGLWREDDSRWWEDDSLVVR